jgi:predicted aspartyl protease
MIRGQFDAIGRPLVPAEVDLPRLNFRKRISLLIDTGADRTALHPKDCEGMPYTLLGNISVTSGIGGSSRYYGESARIYFWDREHSCFHAYEQVIDIAEPTETNEWVPSLLGQDILRYWRVVHDRPTNTLTFEPRRADFRVPGRS